MKITTWRRINRDDLGTVPKESWEFVDKLLEVLNPALEQVSDLAQRGISFIDNTNCAEVVLEVAQDTEVEVLVNIRGKPLHAMLMASAYYDYARLKWRVIDQTKVAFSVKWDTAPAEAKQVRVLFFGV